MPRGAGTRLVRNVGMGTHRVAAIGLASWDEFFVTDHYPRAGSYAVVRDTLEQSGGTTSNLAAALARLGIEVTLAAMVGDDAEGRRLRDELAAEGCDVRYLRTRDGEPTDRSLIVVSATGVSAERTIFWRQGARLRRGDPLPIEEMFAHDLVVVDVDDPSLRRLIVDLPMHVSPRTRLLGTLTYLVEVDPDVGLDLALRHDYIVGNEAEARYLTGTQTMEQAILRLQSEMTRSQARFCAISRGASGCVLFDRSDASAFPAYEVEAVDTTGAGDAFAAGVIVGILEQWPWPEIARFANAMGALAVRRLGARAGLPTRSELERFILTARTREVVE